MSGDFLGHLVAFQRVLKGAHFEAVVFRGADHHENLVGAVTMDVHVALALQNLLERLQFQIGARWDGMFALGHLGVVGVPIRLIALGVVEGFADDVFHAHAGGGIARHGSGACAASTLRIAGAFGVFAQRELNARGGAGENHFLRALAPAHLHDVPDVDHRGDRHAAFIDTARSGDVRVAIDDAGDEILSAGFDDGGAGRHHHLLADLRDLAVFHHHRPLEDPLRAFRHHGGILNHDGFGAQRRERQQRAQ